MIFLLKLLNSIRIDFHNFIVKRKQSIKYRVKNKHNFTTLSNKVKNSSIIEVGENSYGEIITESFGNPNEGLRIGNYVSIASNVTFILGGNHQQDCFTTYPLKSIFVSNSPVFDAITNGPIVVEDEVWIGSNVSVLSGVTIGKGAIIAAGSIVTKNVDAYSIVGGIPAKFIKYRIDKELISLRNQLNLIDIPREKIVENIDLFYSDFSKENFEEIQSILTNDGILAKS